MLGYHYEINVLTVYSVNGKRC